MEERSWLGGAVTVRTLPGPGEGRLFRVEDARGEVAWPVAAEAFAWMHVVEWAEAGIRRGFHRHDAHEEVFYVFRGELRMLARASSSSETVDVEVRAGDRVRFAPGTAHGFVSLTPALGIAVGDGEDPFASTVPTPELAEALG